MTTMNKLNQIWKDHTGADLTTEEAWEMVGFVKMIYENADRNLDKFNQITNTQGKEAAEAWLRA